MLTSTESKGTQNNVKLEIAKLSGRHRNKHPRNRWSILAQTNINNFVKYSIDNLQYNFV